MAEEREQEEPEVRAFWSGTISFGLVAIPVQLLAGNRAAGPSLRTLAPDGTPLAREYYCPADGEPLDPDDLARGYALGEGEHVLVTDEELEALEPDRSRDIDLRRFVRREEVDPALFERAYLLAPGGSALKAYRLLADTLERSGRVGVATFVMRGREHLVAIFAQGGVLHAQTLRFADELRPPEEADLPLEGRAPRKLVRAFEQEIDRRTFDELPREALADEGAAALRALAEEKRARGEDLVEVSEEVGGAAAEAEAEPVDVVEVLRRSLRLHAGGKAAHEPSPAGDLEGLSKEELYERAKAAAVPGRSKMSKPQLVAALRRAA